MSSRWISSFRYATPAKERGTLYVLGSWKRAVIIGVRWDRFNLLASTCDVCVLWPSSHTHSITQRPVAQAPPRAAPPPHLARRCPSAPDGRHCASEVKLAENSPESREHHGNWGEERARVPALTGGPIPLERRGLAVLLQWLLGNDRIYTLLIPKGKLVLCI